MRAPKYLKPVIDHLTEHGETQMTALAEAIGVSPATLYSGVATAIARGEIVKRSEGRAVFYGLGNGTPAANDTRQRPEPVADTGPQFNAALWADGELILWNVDLNEDGRSLTLNADETRTLRRLLVGA